MSCVLKFAKIRYLCKRVYSRKAYSRLLRDMENLVRFPTEMDTDAGLLFYVKYRRLQFL